MPATHTDHEVLLVRAHLGTTALSAITRALARRSRDVPAFRHPSEPAAACESEGIDLRPLVVPMHGVHSRYAMIWALNV